MASRRLVSASVRDSLLGIASDIGSLERNYVLPDDDLALIATRRRPDNRCVRHRRRGHHPATIDERHEGATAGAAECGYP